MYVQMLKGVFEVLSFEIIVYVVNVVCSVSV